MNQFIISFSELLLQTVKAVGISLQHNWKILSFAIILAVLLKTYVNSEKLSQVLMKRKRISILASVAFGAFTPLCACGTTAVIIGMLTTTMPWGPVMAFLTSSPLMSPDGFIMLSGLIHMRFAIALTIASVVIGIASGFITNVIEKRTDFLKDQSRFAGRKPESSCSCKEGRILQLKAAEPSVCTFDALTKDDLNCSTPSQGECACQTLTVDPAGIISNSTQNALGSMIQKLKLKEFLSDLYTLGIRQILLFYIIFVAIGFLINYFVPSSIVTFLFGADSITAVPLAAMIGLPLYITTDSGIPIIQSMLQSGASEGAMLAFMITGSATSAWVIAGLATFLKKRAIILYVLFVVLGGILSGYLFDFINLFL